MAENRLANQRRRMGQLTQTLMLMTIATSWRTRDTALQGHS